MVYIHVKKVGNKNYYTLRVSSRDKQGNVITKDLENLGNDITKITIENLEKKYKKEIRQSYRTIEQFLESNKYLHTIKKQKLKKSPFFTKDQLEQIEATRLHFQKKFLKTHPKTKEEIYKMFLIKFAVSSTAIEGNTITLQEANKLFTQQVLPKGRTLREVYDLQNTDKVFFSLLKNNPKISFDLLPKVHDALLEKIDERIGYRTHEIRILGQPFKPSPARYVKADVKILLKWMNEQKKTIHPLALAIFFHHKFESIHPFSDGNGRTGRILMNHFLIQNNYPPFIIPLKQRNAYLEVMQESEKAIKKSLLATDMSNYKQLFQFLIREYLNTYWNTFLL